MAVLHGFGLNSPMTANPSIPDPKAKNPDETTRGPEKPGALQGQVWLTLQTSQAQLLVHGRNGTTDKATIIGLVGFADRLRVIWQAARGDDPYADWWLIKVHEAIERVAQAITSRQADLDKQLAAMTAMTVSVATSRRPYRVHLQFANPYAYRSARLVADYDRLVCTALTARHIGLLDGETCSLVPRACAHRLRALFMIPQGYRFLKIDRETVRLRTGRSHAARVAMGEVPDDILNGARRAPLVPRKIKVPTGMAGHIGLHPEPANGHQQHADDQNDDR